MPRRRTRPQGASLAYLVVLVLAAGPARAADPVRLNGSGSALDLMKPLLAAYAAAHPGSPEVASTALSTAPLALNCSPNVVFSTDAKPVRPGSPRAIAFPPGM